MLNLYLQLSDAKSYREIDKIVTDNILTLDDEQRLFFCRWANNAKRRILRAKNAMNEEFKTFEKN